MVYFSMGETNYFQPLTKEDKITVVLYRTGILLSALILGISAFILFKSLPAAEGGEFPFIVSGLGINILLLILYFSVGLSVFFIHLYIGKFHRILKKIYYVAVLCLAILFFIGHGNPAMPLFRVPPYAALLLLPLSLCLGFVTAKEAFCFRLIEGYMLAILMPAYVFFYSVGAFSGKSAAYSFMFIAAMLVFFTFRKIFMPVHYDIGDKSAYQP
ncbi:MAG: hypothetical protein EHM54_06685 [Nitrospiraceae bacterium]|nr:MAG: hypothetical protein EHM54_06685 [Nitrospiraceae bacterium]